MSKPTYSLEAYYRPGRSWTSQERDCIQGELRKIGTAALPYLPDYNCFSGSPSVFDDKVLVTVREGGCDGPMVGFVSCILLKVEAIGTVLHTRLTCVLPKNQRQGLQGRLHRRLHRLLCAEFPNGVWFTSVSSSLCSLVGITLATSDVYPSPGVTTPHDRHRAIARAISEKNRQRLDIADDVVFDHESFIFYSSPESLWWKSPTDTKFHHRNTTINGYYAKILERVPGSEILQIEFVDPTVYVGYGNWAVKVGHASTMHSILDYVSWVPDIVSYIKRNVVLSTTF